jgi:predicted HD phosphohydrolase
MEPITKDYLDQKFESFGQQLVQQLNKDIDIKLAALSVDLKRYTREQIEELATMVKAGFDHVDEQLAHLKKRY